MTYAIHTNENFTLTMNIEILENLKQINVIVTLTNHMNGKKDRRTYLASDFSQALGKYKEWERFLFD